MRRARAVLLGLLLAQLAAPAPAWGHRFAPSLLRLFEVAPGEYNVVWKTPAQGISAVPLRPLMPASCRAVAGGGGELEGSGVVSQWRLRCAGPLVGAVFAVSGLADNQASVLFSLERRGGIFHQALLSAERPQFRVPEEPTAPRVMREYAWLGVAHIWSGVDHLLFVFGLLLLVGGGRRLVWTITSFTLGHSITLALVTLGHFEYPVALVEFAIALSIFALAVELARGESASLFRRRPWPLAGGFGLLHGMGFAGALAQIGLPRSELPLALLSFNVGIEIGQLAFIFALWGAWLLARGPARPWRDRLLPVPVYLLGALSAMWCIERGLEAL